MKNATMFCPTWKRRYQEILHEGFFKSVLVVCMSTAPCLSLDYINLSFLLLWKPLTISLIFLKAVSVLKLKSYLLKGFKKQPELSQKITESY
jgi:hypothetical protein